MQLRLDTTLTKTDSQKIKEIIQQSKQFDGVSLATIIKDMRNNIHSPFLPFFNDWFSFIFGTHPQTVNNDSDNSFIIGHTFDTTADFFRTSRIFKTIRPTMSFREINKLTDEINQPLIPLNQTEIQELLYWSLVGMPNIDRPFKGYLSILEHTLLRFNTAQLPFHQLLSLLSVVSRNNGRIDDLLLLSLQQLDLTKNDLAVMDYFIDASNIRFSIPLQNQQLKLAALFHGKINATNLDVHITKQVVTRFDAGTQNITLQGETPKWGLPIGDYQDHSFKGFVNKTIAFAPTWTSYPDATKWIQLNAFGTSDNDFFNLTNSECFPFNEGPIAAVAFGGDGADYFLIGKGVTRAYLAGNKGKDTYVIQAKCVENPLQLIIYDSDHLGEIYFGSPNPYNKFAGPVVDGQLTLGSNKVEQIQEKDGTTTLYVGGSYIQILDYHQGQFDITTGLTSHPVASESYPVFGAINSAGQIALLSAEQSNLGGKLIITQLNGTQINSLQTLNSRDIWQDVSVVALQNNAFVVAGVSKQGCQLTYTLIEPPFNTANITIVDFLRPCNDYLGFSTSWASPIGPDQMQAGIAYRKSSPSGTYVYLPDQQPFRIGDIGTSSSLSYMGTTNRGFIVSIPYQNRDFSYGSQLMEFDSSGRVILNQTLPWITISTTSPRTDGYFVFYAHGREFNPISQSYSATVTNGMWSTGVENSCRANYITKPVYAVSQTLKDGNTLVMGYPDICLFNARNEIMLHPFYLYSNVNNQDLPIAMAQLANNDNITLLYTTYGQNGFQQKVVELPPTFVPKESMVQEDRLATREAPSTFNNDEPAISGGSQLQPPDPIANMMLALVLIELGKNFASGLASMFYAWMKPKVVSEEFKVLKAEIVKQHNALIEQAKPFFKEDYQHDYCRWELEDMANDIQATTDIEALVNLQKEIVKFKNTIWRNNSSRYRHDTTMQSNTPTTSLLKTFGLCGQHKLLAAGQAELMQPLQLSPSSNP
jgi:hypothetical protein